MTTEQLNDIAARVYPTTTDPIEEHIREYQRAAYIKGLEKMEEVVKEYEELLVRAAGGYVAACKDYWKAKGVHSESKLDEMAKELDIFKESAALLDKYSTNIYSQPTGEKEVE